ncbi:DUF4255 domain-containing protein [Leifsonia poae]|uniref:Pvc16 N-terminal domain-containing protein n=1 Tax=Leifsonia poae TaxID=110933 RepID=A0A9W6HCD7_9MICO|nr:DUF4255 domain-containing protein [Leifsonia poae]GLJ77198.1 hypothetical protein GCM10017584_27720 [Leifsonia poae]
MSNSLAVAATTNAIRNLLLTQMPALDAGLAGLAVTTAVPAAARVNQVGPSVNLFLYRTAANPAWRNQDYPAQVHAGESGRPPLALDLHYLLTFFAPDDADKDAMSHRVTAAALSVLHDHAVLDGAELDAALTGNDTSAQPERVRLTPESLSVAEMSELWTTFQSGYRLSASYLATVVLIDSRSPVSSPLPVLRRGSEDRGPVAVAGAAPVLRGVRPIGGRPAARLGEAVALVGDNLSPDDTVIRFTSTMRPAQGEDPPAAIELAAQPGFVPDELSVTLPDQATVATALGDWVPGFYAVTVVVRHPDQPALVDQRGSGVGVAPTITVNPDAAAGSIAVGSTLTVTAEPRVRDSQSAVLLFGSRQLPPLTRANPAAGDPAIDTTPTTFTFEVPAVPPGTYVVRLRIDGVDSVPWLAGDADAMPSFDPQQQVVVA